MKKQSLFLLFGGKLKNVSSDQFKEVKNIDIIGIYDNLVDASKNWKSISIKNIDNALLRYKVVPLNNILDPSESVFEYIQSVKKNKIKMDNVIVAPENTIKQTCMKLKESNTGAAIIVNKKSLIGIFTEKDLVKIISKGEHGLLNQTIYKYMTKPVIYVTPKEKIIKAIELMKINGIRHLPVYTKNDKNLYGVISYKDFTIKSIGLL